MQVNPSQPATERLLRLSQCEAYVGPGKTARFDRAVTSRRDVAWPESAIQAWIQERIRLSKTVENCLKLP